MSFLLHPSEFLISYSRSDTQYEIKSIGRCPIGLLLFDARCIFDSTHVCNNIVWAVEMMELKVMVNCSGILFPIMREHISGKTWVLTLTIWKTQFKSSLGSGDLFKQI